MPGTKVAVPDLPAHLVSRPRLLAVLEEAGGVAVISVCAPAGTGKTLLLAEWAHRHGPVCWVSLDTDDNDERRLWSAVLGALETHPGIGRSGGLAAVDVPSSPDAAPAFLAAVGEVLEKLPEPVVLVLDGVQEITAPTARRELQSLLRHQPAGLRLIISGRLDPPLSLARLRLADQLAEIGAAQLQFTEAEAAALFAIAGVEVSADLLARLTEETGGWAVGLRLAADAAVREGGLEGLLAGHDRALQQYLDDELLSPLDDELRRLLVSVSVCPAVSPELARELSGRPDAAAALHDLRERVMVLEQAGTRDYRLPPLLRTYLVTDLGRRDPDRLAALHATAVDWFEANQSAVAALEHAVPAGNPGRLMRLLRRHGIELFVSGAHRALRQALGTLDEATLGGDPLLGLLLACLHLELGETGTAGLHLASADDAWPADPAPELIVLRQLTRARLAALTGKDFPSVAGEIDLELARRTGLRLLAVVERLCATDATGERARLEAVLTEAESAGQRHVVVRCLTLLSWAAGRSGDYRALSRFADVAKERTREAGRTVSGTIASAMSAYGSLLRAEPVEAAGEASRAGYLAGRWGPCSETELPAVAEVVRGAAEFELGDWYRGLRRMERARARMPAGDGTGAALCGLLEQRAALLLGAGDHARDVLRWSQEVHVRPGELALMRARAQLALGRHSLATHSLTLLFDGGAPTTVAWTPLEAMVTGARIALAADEREQARRWLERALSTAEETGVWYPLVFASPEVVEALTALLGRLGTRERFAARVLGRRRKLNCPPVPVPLTERERSVLRLLPTLRSIEEIAEDLTVSPNTVKTHVRGIYAKLSVSRRRDAVAVAIRQGLLEPRDEEFLG
ncbi:hypothetical protein FPZ12_008815 [Amycolatopsis acidicola]|uniref:HTH luxR-type domain-containing protein n=1 Tax=Amycolatopsis acidicola TaxID=2596893 RepID=A0A5N0VDL3_9PSEU|nr:hypothetical protein FPZ12_008815 [Amycolatopsis acidicola]